MHPRPVRLKASLLSLLCLFVLMLALAPASHAADASWIRVNTTAQGQFLTKLQAQLTSGYGQGPTYDYGVVKKLAVSGTLNAQDYSDLRSALYAGTSIQKLDLSGLVDASPSALGGMTALTDVSLPPVGSFTLANPFQGDANLHDVVVAADTYAFGSATTFNGITGLQRITFLHPTKPSFNASTFAGSSNATPTITAAVPDATRGDYDKSTFTGLFANVVQSPTSDDVAELQNVIDEARTIPHGSAAAEFRWTLLQNSITSAATVHDDVTSTVAAIYRARLVLQTAINAIGSATPALSLKVTHGADVTLSWKNGTAQHYAEFTPRTLAKVDALSTDAYDVYVPTTTVPYVTQNIASAVIHGQTDKVAKVFTSSATATQYTLDLTPLAGRPDTSLTIPGLGAGDNRGLYTNLDDTGVLNLGVGGHFDLDTFRTQQAQLDQVNNLFIEPDYTFDVSGDSIATSNVGGDGRRQLRITAVHPGVSVVKITYGPLHYLTASDNGTPGTTNWSFNGIDPQNTGLAVVNVGGDVGTFASGITSRNDLETYYFDKTVGSRDFTFTPAAGTTVRVHDPLNVSPWGSGWHAYDAAPDGSFTVKLKAGRNIVELTNGGKVEYRVVRAKGVDVTVANTTDPGQPFAAGDIAQISLTGIEGGIEKLSGIYNPAFNAGTKGMVTYYDGTNQLTSNQAAQYQSAITAFKVNYTDTGVDRALNGDMFIGGLGADFSYHRQIPLEGKPTNLAAAAMGPYHFGGMPPIYVHDNQVSTTPGVQAAPTGLQAAYGNGSAALTWTAPAPTSGLAILGYRVRYSSDADATWSTRTFAAGTSQTLTGLTNGTTYDVQVAALNSTGTGTYTASRAVTPRTAPGVPTNVALTTRHDALDAAWTAPTDSGGSDITGYRVRSSSDGGQTWTTHDDGTATHQTLTGLSDGTSYQVQVAATNAEGTGAFSASATATPAKTSATLGTPAASGLTTTSAKVTTAVDPGDLDQAVTVEYATSSDHGNPSVSAATAVTGGSANAPVTISLTGLTSNTTYSYRVVAKASDADVASSSWLTFTTDKVAASVGTPSALDVVRTTASVSASVTAGDLAQTVTVEYSTQADHSVAVTSAAQPLAAGAPAGNVTFPLSGLASQTTYHYRVVAKASDDDVVASGWGTFTTQKVPAAIGTPSVSDITPTTASVSASVAAGDLAQTATVEYSTAADHSAAVTTAPHALPADPTAATVTLPLSGLASHTTYHYRVVSQASDGDVVASDWASFTTKKVPAALGATSVSAIDTKQASVSAVVTPGDLAQDVTVQLSTNADHSGAKTSAVTTVPAGAEATTVTTALAGLAPGTQYSYRVVLTASDGDTADGSWASFTTATPDAPTLALHVSATNVRVGDAVKLSWTAGGADTLTATGGWSGTRAATGTQSIVVGRAGAYAFSLAATGAGGTTTATVDVRVALAAASFTVKTTTGLVHVGRSATVTAAGLAGGEAYRITIGGTSVGTGVTPASGSVSKVVAVPSGLADGTVPVRVLGSVSDRAGSTSLHVVAAKKLTVKVAKRTLAKGRRQQVTVSGLAASEQVRLVYRGKQLAVVTASRRGIVTKAFAVGRISGTKTVTAYGVTPDRTGARTFRVTR